MMKKQMMMALVSLMALTAQAQANFNVTVTNPSKMVKTDQPVVIDLSKLGSIGEIQRAVVTVDGKEIPSQLDDTNRDCTNDELCFLLDLGKKEESAAPVEHRHFAHDHEKGFCPNPHCPSNHAYEVEGRRLVRPDRNEADPVGATYCAVCGEVLEKRCPNCGAPLHEGAVCSYCGEPYVAVAQ